jgi:hypothetical protein
MSTPRKPAADVISFEFCDEIVDWFVSARVEEEVVNIDNDEDIGSHEEAWVEG